MGIRNYCILRETDKLLKSVILIETTGEVTSLHFFFLLFLFFFLSFTLCSFLSFFFSFLNYFGGKTGDKRTCYVSSIAAGILLASRTEDQYARY